MTLNHRSEGLAVSLFDSGAETSATRVETAWLLQGRWKRAIIAHMSNFNLHEIMEFVWSVLVTELNLLTGVVGFLVFIVERIIRKTTSWTIYLSLVGISIFASCYMNWEDQRIKLTDIQRGATIMFDEAIEKESIIKNGTRIWYINFTIKTNHGIVHNVLPYITFICLTEGNKCSDKYVFNNRTQITFRNEQKQGEPVTLDTEGYKITAFSISKPINNNILNTSFIYRGGLGCDWCFSLKNGKYKISIIAAGDEAQTKVSFIIDWYGDAGSLLITPQN